MRRNEPAIELLESAAAELAQGRALQQSRANEDIFWFPHMTQRLNEALGRVDSYRIHRTIAAIVTTAR